jgi:hypothetical protein
MSNELEKLTEEFLSFKNQFDEHGRKSLRFVIECGRRLTLIKGRLTHGRWEEWCGLNCDGKSMSTIKRWIRVYNRSLVTDLSKMTLDEVYESMKKKKDKKPPKPNDPPKTDHGSTNTTQDKPQSKFEGFKELLWKLSDIGRNEFDETETKELVRLLEPVVKWYYQKVSVDTVPAVEMEPVNELAKAA